MLRISKLTDYGIVLLSHLAADERGETRTAREMAEHARLPVPVVSKLLKTLAREGILESRRGAHGGYGLARDPERVTVAELIGVLEGPIALTECGLAAGLCSQEASCRVRDPWQQINGAIYEALSQVTLADLVRPSAGALLPLSVPGAAPAVGAAGARPRSSQEAS